MSVLRGSEDTGQSCIPASHTWEQTTNSSVLRVSQVTSHTPLQQKFLLSSFLLPPTGWVVHRPYCQQPHTRAGSPSPQHPPRHTVIAPQPRQQPVFTLQPPTNAVTAGQPAQLTVAAWSSCRHQRSGVLSPSPVPHRLGGCRSCVARTRMLASISTTDMRHLSEVRHHMLSECRSGVARVATVERAP